MYSRRSELWYSCASRFHPTVCGVENVTVRKGCCLSYQGLTLVIGATFRLENRTFEFKNETRTLHR